MAEQPYMYHYSDAGPVQFAPPTTMEGVLHSPGSLLRGLAIMGVVCSTFVLSYLGDEDTERGLMVARLSQVIVAGLGIYILLMNAAVGTRLVFTPEFVLYAGFFAWAMFGFPFAVSPEFSQVGIVTLAKLLVMAVVLLNAVNGRAAYMWLLAGIIVAMLIMSFGAITGLARGAEVTATGSLRYTGTFGNANEAGILACLGGWAAFSLLISTRSRFVKMLLILVMAWAIVVIGWTASKGAMLALIVGALTGYWFVLRRVTSGVSGKLGWLVLLSIAFVGLGAYFATTYGGQRFMGAVESRGTDSSDQARFHLLMNSVRTFAENPFLGIGYGCSRVINPRTMSPHNTIVAIAAETGLAGWILFFTPWLLIMNRLRRVGRLSMLGKDYRLALSAWILLAMFGVWIWVGEMGKFKPFWVCFAAMIGYLAWIERTWHTQQEQSFYDVESSNRQPGWAAQ